MKKGLLFSLLLLTTLFSCKEDSPEDEPIVDTRYSAQLPELYNNFIVPELNATVAEVTALRESAEAFDVALDASSLENLQNQLKNARLQWQRISLLWFGPGDEQGVVKAVNTFPIDANDVSSNADAGNTSSITEDEKGFCTLGWLLHHDEADVVLSYFTDASFGNARRAYLLFIANDIESAINNLDQAWDNGFGSRFVNATGASVGTGMSLYHNGYARDYENLKREKVALPLGLLTLDIPLPEKAEAYYAGYSVELGLAHLQSTVDALSANGTGGVLALIDELGAFHSPSNQNLSDAISEQLEAAQVAFEQVPDPLAQTILNDPAIVQAAYDELQAAVVLLKVDLTSALDVSITYTDTDGD